MSGGAIIEYGRRIGTSGVNYINFSKITNLYFAVLLGITNDYSTIKVNGTLCSQGISIIIKADKEIPDCSIDILGDYDNSTVLLGWGNNRCVGSQIIIPQVGGAIGYFWRNTNVEQYFFGIGY